MNRPDTPPAPKARDEEARRAQDRAALVKHEGRGAAGWDYLSFLAALDEERGLPRRWEDRQ